MKEKEFKRLNRKELVEIIYQLQKEIQELQDENTTIKSALESKELKISEAGSIAEAVIGLSDIFNNAQSAADRYLEEIHRSNAEIEERNNALIADAKAKADEILQSAESKAEIRRKEAEELKMKAQVDARRIVNSAEQRANAKLSAANEKIEQMLKAHAELTELFK